LDEKDHQESDDRRAGVYDQLPRVTEVKHRTCNDPNNDDNNS